MWYEYIQPVLSVLALVFGLILLACVGLSSYSLSPQRVLAVSVPDVWQG